MSAVVTGGEKFETYAPLLIIGAGAAGLCAALAAKEAGVEPVVIEPGLIGRIDGLGNLNVERAP